MRIPFRVKIAAVMGFGFLIVLSATSIILYRLAAQSIIEEFGQKLVTVVVNGAQNIDGDAFAKLTRPSQMSSKDYRKIQSRLRRLKTVNGQIRFRFLYTMAPTSKPGLWRYVVDSASEDSKDFSPLGATEDFTYDPRWLKPLRKPMAEDQLRDYQGWGSLISASAPIFNRAGNPVGVLSVDASAQTVADALQSFRRRSLGCALVGLFLCLVLSLPLARQVTRPIKTLIAGTQAMANGDFDYRVPIAQNDEVGDFAKAFNLMAKGLRERELYRQQFGRYVSRQIADKILANPEKSFWDAERRRVTILFSDIRGFTSMSEKVPPEVIVARLNEYLALMIDIVFKHEGTLDKFIGDAVMALFGAPLSLGNDEERAVRAAVDMQKAAADLSWRWAKQGLPEFKIGIGIHTGEIVVGNIGSEKRMEYSAIGDAVNLASRLESLNKEYKTSTLISEETYNAVKKIAETRFVDNVNVRGRVEPVTIYEVTGMRV